MTHHHNHLPLVYSCSGCSSAAQLANHLAVKLDRAGLAEMSCIAGIGGGVPSLVRKAQEAQAAGRPIMALDGCALACVQACLDSRQVQASVHVQLQKLGVKKVYHEGFVPDQAGALFDRLAAQALELSSRAAGEEAKGCGGHGGCACAA
ncbi:putative zinc-binding protein [Mitsuaria sp. WAJ17]|uniref:putative zinc-binding protein n=1 Tax=Mitsuaria sp. WAJ17 TaxID=2761452 RepID=UPI001600E4C4|nr:putative zinc-binding protein [Mitsuaria sp. WAJ17]MBB2488090.1 putative zinc-binding protein [Mitsuaria sp. WAJ17]